VNWAHGINSVAEKNTFGKGLRFEPAQGALNKKEVKEDWGKPKEVTLNWRQPFARSVEGLHGRVRKGIEKNRKKKLGEKIVLGRSRTRDLRRLNYL